MLVARKCEDLFRPSEFDGVNDYAAGRPERTQFWFVLADEPIELCYAERGWQADATEYEAATFERVAAIIGEFFPGEWTIAEVDESEVMARGYGRYRNPRSDDWESYAWIPEVVLPVYGTSKRELLDDEEFAAYLDFCDEAESIYRF